MNDLIQIDAKEAGSKLAVFKHYYQEILLITFAIALVFLFNFREADKKTRENERIAEQVRYDALAKKLEDYLNNSNKVMIEKVSENTLLLKEVLEYLKELKKK